MYSVFALILGVSQIAALVVFPLDQQVLQAEDALCLATALVVAGYLIFLCAA